MTRPWCDCFAAETPVATWPALEFHWDIQDTTCGAWHHLLALVDEAAADGRTTFAPFKAMTRADRTEIVTLPATIGRLTAVRELDLYGSHLVWLPPDIGAMTSLEEFVPYTSWCLHWFPYEITRCRQLRESTVSTRSLYGNYKYRWPFPPLSAETLGVGTAVGAGTSGMQECSVCRRVVPGRTMQQVWISQVVATDVLPLLG